MSDTKCCSLLNGNLLPSTTRYYDDNSLFFPCQGAKPAEWKAPTLRDVQDFANNVKSYRDLKALIDAIDLPNASAVDKLKYEIYKSTLESVKEGAITALGFFPTDEDLDNCVADKDTGRYANATDTETLEMRELYQKNKLILLVLLLVLILIIGGIIWAVRRYRKRRAMAKKEV